MANVPKSILLSTTKAGAMLDAMDSFRRPAVDPRAQVSLAPEPPVETPRTRYSRVHLIVASTISAAGSFALAVAWLG
jgi:hypothetical protein